MLQYAHTHYMHSADTFEIGTRLKSAVRGQICLLLTIRFNLKLIQVSFNTSIN